MSIVAGYTNSEGVDVVIGTYDDPSLAETAISEDEASNVSQYWLATFVNPETGEPEILAYVEP